MSHRVVFSASARRDVAQVPPRIVSAIVEFVYGDLAASPYRVGKPLQRELTGIFSARRGLYRILYEIDNTTSTIHSLRVDHRSDIYRRRSEGVLKATRIDALP